MKEKKLPLRKCTGCQEMKSKKELTRIVKDEENKFIIDKTGKKEGRGAYVCTQSKCLEKALKSKGFERSFKQAVPKDVYESLKKELESNG